MGSSIPPEEAGHGVASAEPPTGDSGSPGADQPARRKSLLRPRMRPRPRSRPRRANAPPDDEPPLSPPRRRRRRRKVLIWTASITAGLVALAAVGVFMVYRHLNGNIQQRDVSGLLGSQPVDLHPQAENILVIGSDTRFGQGKGYGSGLVTDQSDTTMIVHIAANRQWAEVMSIPRDSYVSIPACTMGNGQMSSPQTFKINEAYAIGNLDGNHTALGVACTMKTVEQDTGIYLDHFVVVNFTGFQNMVSALGGVEECNTQPINDPKSHLQLTAGKHLLNPKQALAYVRARYTLGDGSDLERIGRQQAFMSSLIQRVKSKLLNPVAIYRFLDAATKSLTIDTKLGGATGLYNLASSLRSLPSNKVAFFTLPTYPRLRGGSGRHRQRAVDAARGQQDLPDLPRRRSGQPVAVRQPVGQPVRQCPGLGPGHLFGLLHAVGDPLGHTRHRAVRLHRDRGRRGQWIGQPGGFGHALAADPLGADRQPEHLHRLRPPAQPAFNMCKNAYTRHS